jgi:hypothetical protein
MPSYSVSVFLFSVFFKELMRVFVQVTMFVFGVVSIEVWHTQFPVWGFVISLLIGA